MIQSWLTDRKSGIPLTTFRVNIWHEHHEDGHPHTHMLVELDVTNLPKRRVDRRLGRELDWCGVHPNIKSLKNETHYRNAVAYRNKEPDYLLLPDGSQIVTSPLVQVEAAKPRNMTVLLHQEVMRRLEAEEDLEPLLTAPDWGPHFMSRPNLWEFAQTLKEQFLRMRDLRDVPAREPDREYWVVFLRPYFVDFLRACESNDRGWNNRRVFWIYDPRGCGQKTLLAEYLWRTCHDVRELTAGRDCDLQYTCQVTDRVFVFDMPHIVTRKQIGRAHV